MYNMFDKSKKKSSKIVKFRLQLIKIYFYFLFFIFYHVKQS